MDGVLMLEEQIISAIRESHRRTNLNPDEIAIWEALKGKGTEASSREVGRAIQALKKERKIVFIEQGYVVTVDTFQQSA